MSVRTKALQVLSEKTGCPVSADDDLTVLGDSLDLIDCVMTLESDFDIAISDKETAAIRSVNDLVNLVDAKAAGEAAR